jgi:chromosome segregation and condensation protein ScpB
MFSDLINAKKATLEIEMFRLKLKWQHSTKNKRSDIMNDYLKVKKQHAELNKTAVL